MIKSLKKLSVLFVTVIVIGSCAADYFYFVSLPCSTNVKNPEGFQCSLRLEPRLVLKPNFPKPSPKEENEVGEEEKEKVIDAKE